VKNVVEVGEGKGKGGAAGAAAPNPIAQRLCTLELLTELLAVLELWACHLPVARLALALLTELLRACPRAAAQVGASASCMARLRTVRSEHSSRLARLRAGRERNAAMMTLSSLDSRGGGGGGGASAAEAAAAARQGSTHRQLQRQSLWEVEVEAGSEGFSLEGTMHAWEGLMALLRGGAAAAAAAAAGRR
jgi:hypothetical protein